MSAKIDLGHLTNATFTSGDTVHGKLLLNFDSPETVRDITVKLEGVSFSRVPIPQDEYEKRKKKKERFAFEIHKFLYKSQIVFPPKQVAQASNSNQFTLPAGNHEFDFSIVLPPNTDCPDIKQPSPYSLSRLVIDSSGIDYARDATSHFAGPMPPALSDMKEIASVRYFLKATVHRASLLRMNTRVYHPIVYITPDILDINVSATEIRFARRQVAVWMEKPSSQYLEKLENDANSTPVPEKKKSRFKSLFSGPSAPVAITEPSTLPIMLDMRYPNYFNPTQTLPIRLFVINMTSPTLIPGPRVLYLQELTFKLYATTDTKAQAYNKQHTHSLTLLNSTNMLINFPLSEFSPTTVPNLNDVWEAELPSSLWEKVKIPDSVAPTFQTCNIRRSYSFEVIAGFSMVPGATPNYVSIVGDIKLLSGITANNCPELSIPPLPQDNKGKQGTVPAPNSKTANKPGPSANSDLPPSYGEVVRSEVLSDGSEQQAPPQPPRPGQALGINNRDRRSYQQSNSYYSGLESFDPDAKN